jgi:hypothetical protein
VIHLGDAYLRAAGQGCLVKHVGCITAGCRHQAMRAMCFTATSSASISPMCIGSV